MAEQHHQLTDIREAVVRYDEDALSALANRGLLRRAAKDLEGAQITCVEETADSFRIDTGEAVVTLLLPLQASRCTCPANGICRHILLAVLWLQQEAPTADMPVIDAGEELCTLTDETLRRWAGTPLWRKALQRLQRHPEVSWSDGPPLVFTFPDDEVTCRWLPGQGPEGMVCACHLPMTCEHRVMAVLAYQAARGVRALTAESDETAVAVRDLGDTPAEISGGIAQMVVNGLSHLSPTTREQMQALAISAHGTDMPRVGRLLQTLATEIELQLQRDARADTGTLLAAAARSAALCRALRAPTAALLGQHRSVYDDVNSVELQGMGMARWQTKSGYLGLTLYFWEPRREEWLTWTDARPANSPDGFSPRQRLHAPGPWTGCTSPAAICRQHLRLQHAGRNAAGRLSGRVGTVAEILPTPAASGPPVLTTWEAVAERAIAYFAAGFQDRDERDALLYLEPAQWGTAAFSEVRQELVLSLLDARGRRLPLRVAYRDDAAEMIALLEQFAWTRGTRVLGVLRFADDQVYVEPLVLYQQDRTINLTLDAPVAKSGLLERLKALRGRRKPATEDTAAVSLTGAVLDAALNEIGIIAEGGLAVRHDTARLRELAARCQTLGLTHAAAPLERLAAGMEGLRHTLTPTPLPVAHTLLHATFILRQMRMLDTLLQATAGLRL